MADDDSQLAVVLSAGKRIAIVDNIPVMFAVFSMNPEMSQARGSYAFFRQLKWIPLIALGCGASIIVYLWVNSGQF